MAEYAAFLRGINVGGKKPVPMAALKKSLEALKFKNVRTLLISGNVVFEAPAGPTVPLEKKISGKLKQTFKMEIGVLVRTLDELRKIDDAKPFKGIEATPDTGLYVTFLSEEPEKALCAPFSTPGGEMRTLRVAGREVFAVVTRSAGGRTVEFMQILEKKFGRQITTRNWNTIQKVLKSSERND